MYCQKRIIAVAALILSAGCNGQRQRIVVPSIDREATAAEAIKLYDSDQDGLLDSKELAECASIRSALRHIDKDGDGKVSASELAQRFKDWENARVAMMGIGCIVSKGGHPLEGATVTFEPEPFLPHLLEGKGITDETGMCGIGTSDPTDIDMLVGFYRVKIRKISQGKETIPAKYNESTTLGFEVSQDCAAVTTGFFQLDLK